MQVVRMYTGDDEKSHFEEIVLPFDLLSEPQRTASESSLSIQFVYQPPGFTIDMHPAPRRQYVITLQGQAEIVLGDGTARRFGVGDVLLAEDLSGEGHVTRVTSEVARISLQVPLRG